MLTGYMGQGYLNHEQAPERISAAPQFAFQVTPGRAATPALYAEPYQPQPVPASPASRRDREASRPTQGPVNTQASSLRGTGLPANAPVSLVWGSYEGNRVSGKGFEPIENELTKVTRRRDGRIDDAGDDSRRSRRPPRALRPLRRARRWRTTYFVIETSIVSMSPASGPAGTPVTIHLKGVGWTEYDNIYVATYDNAYMGYACGFNSQGDVVINFTAAGAPGVHLIDFYPGIYQGPEGGPAALSSAAAHLRGRSSGQPDSRAALLIRGDAFARLSVHRFTGNTRRVTSHRGRMTDSALRWLVVAGSDICLPCAVRH